MKTSTAFLTAREVIERFYRHFEERFNKIVLKKDIEVVHSLTHGQSKDYCCVIYREYLISSMNIIVKGKYNPNECFIRVFKISENENVSEKITQYNYLKKNFDSNIIISQAPNIEICPICYNLSFERIKRKMLNGSLNNPAPFLEELARKYYDTVSKRAEELKKLRRKDKNSEKYDPKIVGLLVSSLEEVLA